MEQEKVYQIYEILAAGAKFLENPTDENAFMELEGIKNSLVVKDYMPIAQKEIVLRKAIIDMRVDEEAMPYTASILYEIALLFDCLLGYVINLDQNIDGLYKDASFYDILKLSGVVDYILKFCAKDYEQLIRMADRMISFDNLNELCKNISIVSPEEVTKLTQAFNNFTTDTNPEVLKRLGDIMAADDPLLANVKNAIEDNAFKIAQETGDNAE